MKHSSGKTFIAAAVLCLALAALDQPLVSESLESRVKAAFIEKFTQFIDWPEDSLHSEGNFIIGIIGYSPITPHLLELTAGRKVGNRDMVLKSVINGPAVSECHIVFIAPGESGNLAAILARVKNRPILTVADSPGFAEKGVMINLFRAGNYVRFEINMDEVKRSTLKFSSKLLVLSKSVGQEGSR